MENRNSLSIQDLKAISEQSEIVNKSIIEFSTSSYCMSHHPMVKSYIDVIRAYQTVIKIVFKDDID